MTVCISPDTKYIVSGGFDQVLRIYDFETKALKYVYDEDESLICSSTFSPDGQVLAFAGED